MNHNLKCKIQMFYLITIHHFKEKRKRKNFLKSLLQVKLYSLKLQIFLMILSTQKNKNKEGKKRLL
jgi:hypothetical protein